MSSVFLPPTRSPLYFSLMQSLKFHRLLLLAPAFACLALVHSSNGAVFLNEHFDSYADQTAFQTAWPISGTASTVLNNEQAVSASQSVKGLTTATRNALSIGEVGFLNGSADTVIFRFNFYDSNAGAAAYRQYAELNDGSAPASAGQLFAMGLNNNIASTNYMARILGGDGGTGVSAFFKLDDVGAPGRTTGWHTLEADITDNDVKYFIDGILSKTVNTSALTDRSLDTVRVGSNLTAGQVAYFDDVYVERVVAVVPEPSACALMVLGLGALVVRRRHRRS
jgi:hypothetical protein